MRQDSLKLKTWKQTTCNNVYSLMPGSAFKRVLEHAEGLFGLRFIVSLLSFPFPLPNYPPPPPRPPPAANIVRCNTAYFEEKRPTNYAIFLWIFLRYWHQYAFRILSLFSISGDCQGNHMPIRSAPGLDPDTVSSTHCQNFSEYVQSSAFGNRRHLWLKKTYLYTETLASYPGPYSGIGVRWCVRTLMTEAIRTTVVPISISQLGQIISKSCNFFHQKLSLHP